MDEAPLDDKRPSEGANGCLMSSAQQSDCSPCSNPDEGLNPRCRLTGKSKYHLAAN